LVAKLVKIFGRDEGTEFLWHSGQTYIKS
jgi:hypothetical protein